jgi:hypothetical protein
VVEDLRLGSVAAEKVISNTIALAGLEPASAEKGKDASHPAAAEKAKSAMLSANEACGYPPQPDRETRATRLFDLVQKKIAACDAVGGGTK